MGVMSCKRKKCENIMCRTYIPNEGYICHECKLDFKDYLEDNDKTDLTEGEILTELEKFMSTDKNSDDKNERMNVNDFFDKHTR